MPFRRYKAEVPRGRTIADLDRNPEPLRANLETPGVAITEEMLIAATFPSQAKTPRLPPVPGAAKCPACGCEAKVAVDAEHEFAIAFECLDCGEGEELTMRLLPCERCRGHATTPDGEAYLFGANAPARFPFRYPCAKCKTQNTLEPFQFYALPLLGPSAFRKMIAAPKDQSVGALNQRFVRMVTDQSHKPPHERLGRLIPPPARAKAAKIDIRRVPLADVRKYIPRG